jgi:hypothetical protein
MEGNAGMLQWLGKQRLDQKERSETETKTVVEVNVNEIREQFRDLIGRFDGPEIEGEVVSDPVEGGDRGADARLAVSGAEGPISSDPQIMDELATLGGPGFRQDEDGSGVDTGAGEAGIQSDSSDSTDER